MKKHLILLLILPLFGQCQNTKKASKSEEKKVYKVVKTDAEWEAILPPLTYQVLRKAATERAFSGPLYNKRRDVRVRRVPKSVVFICPQYESGSGWPSFDRGNDANLEYDVDYKIDYARTEIKCGVCGGHLGHMFDDGPRQTTGKRHCINSAALAFVPKKEESNEK